MKLENVTVWVCDSEAGHQFDPDPRSLSTREDGRPDGWIEVDGATGETLTFCSARCAYMRLMDMHTALTEQAEAGEAA